MLAPLAGFSSSSNLVAARDFNGQSLHSLEPVRPGQFLPRQDASGRVGRVRIPSPILVEGRTMFDSGDITKTSRTFREIPDVNW